jgi:heme oxygenase
LFTIWFSSNRFVGKYYHIPRNDLIKNFLMDKPVTTGKIFCTYIQNEKYTYSLLLSNFNNRGCPYCSRSIDAHIRFKAYKHKDKIFTDLLLLYTNNIKVLRMYTGNGGGEVL